MHLPLPPGWIPYKLTTDAGQLLVHWLYTGDKKFSEPFFEETILKCKSHDYNSRRYSAVSSLEGLVSSARNLVPAAPAAFIFHTSRCGSTLLTQLLDTSPRCMVLSEVPLLDQVMRLPVSQEFLNHRVQEEALKAVIALLAQTSADRNEHVFIKLDSWHVCFHKLLRKLYPETPFILIYRKPEEILRSQQRRRGIHFIPGLMESIPSGIAPASQGNMETYLIKVLEVLMEGLLKIALKDSHSFLVNYNEGGLSIAEKTAASAGLIFSDEEKAAMCERIKFHSKDPGSVFHNPEEMPSFPGLDDVDTLYDKLENTRLKNLSEMR